MTQPRCVCEYGWFCTFFFSFHGMQTAGAEGDINENTVASGRRMKKEIKKERKRNTRQNNTIKIPFLTYAADLVLVTVLLSHNPIVKT